MLRNRLNRYFNPSMAVALTALLAALGGGYAAAFSGSGTLQKGAKFGVGSSFETVRTLTGIGSIKASCASGEVTVRFENTSGKVLLSNADTGAEDPEGLGLANNQTQDVDVAPSAFDDLLRFHISPENEGKRPQADVVVSVVEPPGACGDASVKVLALNTEE